MLVPHVVSLYPNTRQWSILRLLCLVLTPYLVYHVREHNSQKLIIRCPSCLSLFRCLLYSYWIQYTLCIIYYRVIGMHTSQLGLNNEYIHTESKAWVSPLLGWNPTTQKVLSYYLIPQTVNTHTQMFIQHAHTFILQSSYNTKNKTLKIQHTYNTFIQHAYSTK